jgi:hypothetical protein
MQRGNTAQDLLALVADLMAFGVAPDIRIGGQISNHLDAGGDIRKDVLNQVLPIAGGLVR